MLSPNATYASNLSSAEAMLAAWTAGRTIDSFSVATYMQNKRKAWMLLTTDDQWEVQQWFAGKKTRAFFQNVYSGGTSPMDGIVVDGHMYSVWMLKRFGMREAKVGNGKRYDEIANDIRVAANIIGVWPSEMQATCWFAWKRINRISFDVAELQLEMFRDDVTI